MKKRPVVYQSDRDRKDFKKRFWLAALWSALICSSLTLTGGSEVLGISRSIVIGFYLLIYIPIGILVYLKDIRKYLGWLNKEHSN